MRAEYTRVYMPYGRVAHLRHNYAGNAAVCGRFPVWGSYWLGTGSQAEIEKAASLPLCIACDHYVNG